MIVPTVKKIVAYSKNSPWVDEHGVKHIGYILWEFQDTPSIIKRPKFHKEPMCDFLKMMLK